MIVEATGMADTDNPALQPEKNAVLEVLRREIAFQWRWEKFNRLSAHAAILLGWICTMTIVGLSFFQLQMGNELQKWAILSICLLSALSSTLPGLSAQFKFQQRQQVYDEMARAYSLIVIKLEIDAITPHMALELFEKFHERPTEKVIRETA